LLSALSLIAIRYADDTIVGFQHEHEARAFLDDFMLLGMTGGLRAQPRETGPAARRVIIFVWDGLRADDLTPEITPNYRPEPSAIETV
jgi:hypothetical protein